MKRTLLQPQNLFRLSLICLLLGWLVELRAQASEHLPWRAYVSNCVETLIRDGTDRYGPVHTDMLMSILDVQELKSPEKPLLLDGQIYDEERPQRRNPAGANL